MTRSISNIPLVNERRKAQAAAMPAAGPSGTASSVAVRFSMAGSAVRRRTETPAARRVGDDVRQRGYVGTQGISVYDGIEPSECSFVQSPPSVRGSVA